MNRTRVAYSDWLRELEREHDAIRLSQELENLKDLRQQAETKEDKKILQRLARTVKAQQDIAASETVLTTFSNVREFDDRRQGDTGPQGPSPSHSGSGGPQPGGGLGPLPQGGGHGPQDNRQRDGNRVPTPRR